MVEHDGQVAARRETTTYTGPLGSTIHVLQADAGTIAELAAIDWNRLFPRVCLDPVRGLITLMTPSRLHEDLTEILSHIVDAAASLVTGAAKSLRHTRLRGPADPQGTGMEPDCAFYLGERARAYRAALAEGEPAADAFLERTPLDLVVEAEITNRDAGRIGRYAEMGVHRASSGGCTGARAPGSCGWSSSPCDRERSRGSSPTPRSLAASRRTTSARPWTACASA